MAETFGQSDAIGRTFEHGFDRAVGPIAYEARNADAMRRVLGGEAESHALHAAADAQAASHGLLAHVRDLFGAKRAARIQMWPHMTRVSVPVLVFCREG